MQASIKRATDIIFVFVCSLVFCVPALLIACLIKLTSRGNEPILYWSERIGKSNKLFWMPKFRTMRVNTPTVATHLLQNPDLYVTKLGRFLRKTSLDELPQLWCILKGDMSMVGPRPFLESETEIIELRTKVGIDTLLPGLTGWAQINGRDALTNEQKVQYDYEYLQKKSLLFDLKIIVKTIGIVIRRQGILH